MNSFELFCQGYRFATLMIQRSESLFFRLPVLLFSNPVHLVLQQFNSLISLSLLFTSCSLKKDRSHYRVSNALNFQNPLSVSLSNSRQTLSSVL